MWELSFIVAGDHWDRRFGHRRVKQGTWAVKLALLPHSPPTWIDSRLVIEDPRVRGRPDLAQNSSSGPPTSLLEAVLSQGESSETKARPPIEVRLKAREQLTAQSRGAHADNMVLVLLEENALAHGLQFK